MHADEYRFFITRISELETETASLRRILENERAFFDVLTKEISKADVERLEERAAAEAYVNDLLARIKNLERRQWLPGIIGGGGPSRDGGVQAVIGLGWKIDLF